MATTASTTRRLTQSGAVRAKKIPESLIYETIDWSRDIELMNGQYFNVGAYLQKRSITVD